MVGCDTLRACETSGIRSVCDEKNVVFIDFNRCCPMKVKVKGDFIRTLVVAKDLLEFDKIVSVPVMKTHVLTGVSLGMKNMKGIQYRDEKIRLHERGMKMLHVGIVDIIQSFMPYLTVVDGSYGQEGEGPVGGTVVPMNVIVASRDVVAADATACRVMGFNPRDISHIALAEKRQLGSIDAVTVLGDDVFKVARKFVYPYSLFKKSKYRLFDWGMDFAAKLRETTEADRAYRIIMKLMKTMPIIQGDCKKCGRCLSVCPHGAITPDYTIDLQVCKSCLICMEACPYHAIRTKEISLLGASQEILICLLRVLIKKFLGKL
jgi:ferredoxin